MPRQTPSAKPEPPAVVDPLADLREPDAPGLPGATVQANSEAEAEAEVTLIPMVDQATHDRMVATAVAAFHADPTCQGFLHGGGQCGCRYIARSALAAAVPVMTDQDTEERELEPAGGAE